MAQRQLPSIGDTNWGQPLNDWLTQLSPASKGGLNYGVSEPDTTSWGIDNEGYIFVNNAENKVKRWSGSSWETILEAGAGSELGWIDSKETWSYSAYSSSTKTGIITVPGDATTKYGKGMKIRVDQTSGTKYGIITAISSTSLTVFFGTDYILNNETINSAFYSYHKSPIGFPLNPAKWRIQVTDTTDRSYSTTNTWNNLGSINIIVPIGCWDISYQAFLYTYTSGGADAGRGTYSAATLSQSAGTEDNNLFTSIVQGEVGEVRYAGTGASVYKSNVVDTSSSISLHFNAKYWGASTGFVQTKNNISPLIIRADCVYL